MDEAGFDVVFHDGAHDYPTVKKDIQHIVSKMKQNGILLVHDTEHPMKYGNEMMQAVKSALRWCRYEMVTLPYGYGLSIIRIKSDYGNGKVEIKWRKAKQQSTAFTIVIPTYNRKPVLEKLLKRLEHQSDMDFEVIVAVDGSTDGTQAWLEEYKKRAAFMLRWIDTNLTDRYGLAVARNQAIREAKDGPIVILDDDSFPAPHFIEEHKKTVLPKTLTGGKRTSTDPESSMGSKMQEYLDVYGDSTPKNFTSFTRHKNPHVVENNTCMYKKDWLASGMFDESVNEYGRIAQGFIGRLKDAGFKYQFNPRAEIVHKEEYQRSYGEHKKTRRIFPLWIKRTVFPVKRWAKRHTPGFYYWLKAHYKGKG